MFGTEEDKTVWPRGATNCLGVAIDPPARPLVAPLAQCMAVFFGHESLPILHRMFSSVFVKMNIITIFMICLSYSVVLTQV